MGELNVPSRTLFIADNLDVLRGINSESVDLIATDPPFNKGVKDFEGTVTAGTDKKGQRVRYKDVWTWADDVQGEWAESIQEDHPNLYAVIRAANAAAGEDMGAYLCWLGVRVLAMHRVLKSTGSIYIHVDDTAQAYVKAMMDAIFGRGNFRNEIVWNRSGGKSDSKRWGRVHDVLLYYTKDYRRFTWNQQYQPLDPEYVNKTYRYDDGDGRGLYRRLPLHAAGVTQTGDSGKKWRRYDPSTHNRHWAIPSKGIMHQYIIEHGIIPGWPGAYATIPDKLDALDQHDLMVHSISYLPEIKTYLAATKGIAASDFISDIPMASGKEKTGYPTQKPLALYERIIKASSNEGDVVMDPFAGCATTCVAAERLGRGWIGIDLNKPAREVILKRLRVETTKSMAWGKKVRTPSSPPRRTDKGEEAAPELVLVSPRPRSPKLSARELRGQLIIRDGKKCQGCGWIPHRDVYLEVDHRQPKSRNGRDDMHNRVLLCSPCNGIKSNRLTLAELRSKSIDEGWMQDQAWDRAWYEREGRFGEAMT